ncbi:MAG UNVERIFIED_CONTAM: hypothetical protein LVR29_09820 [Microcystis novacekii LVE1205-3]
MGVSYQLSVISLEGVGFWGFRVLVELPIFPFPDSQRPTAEFYRRIKSQLSQ